MQEKQPDYQDLFGQLSLDQQSKKQQPTKKQQQKTNKIMIKQPQPLKLLNCKQPFLDHLDKYTRKNKNQQWQLILCQSQLCMTLFKQLFPVQNLQKIHILNLQKNYIGDQGLQILTSINLPKLQSLSLGNNCLKTIKTIGKFSNSLFCLNLTDDSQGYQYGCQGSANNLNQQAAQSIISVQWKNLNYLTINFKSKIQNQNQDYDDFFTMNAQPNLKAWTIFTNNNFKAFPVLKKLYLPGYKFIGSYQQKKIKDISQKHTNNRVQIQNKNY